MSSKHTSKSESVGYMHSTANSAIPRVLVLLAAYNGEKWICAQIDSILSQANVFTSIIINDDGSSDKTRNLVKNAFENNSRVTILPPSKASGSAAQNFFFLIRSTPATNFDYIALSDQDDIWLSNKLTNAVALLEKNNASAGSSATLAFWPNDSKRMVSLNRPQTQLDYLFEGAGQGCTFLLTSSFYNKVREFISAHVTLTERVHFHDWTIYALARSWGLRWIFDPRPSLLYRQHASNDTGARTSIRGLKGRFVSIKSGWYANQLSLIASICYQAAPENLYVKKLNQLLHARPSFSRRLSLAFLCVSGGRRRRIDNFVLIIAILIGWI